MDDKKIIDLFWERSEEAISKVRGKYSRYCYSIAIRILGNNEDAEECLSDTFMRAWDAIPPARPSNFPVFLGRITRNLSLNYLEKRTAAKRGGGQIELILSELKESIPSVQSNVENIVNGKFLIEVINNFLEGVDKSQRKVFVRRYWYGSSIKEIGDDYGFTDSKVKSILFRTRKKLKIELEKERISL